MEKIEMIRVDQLYHMLLNKYKGEFSGVFKDSSSFTSNNFYDFFNQNQMKFEIKKWENNWDLFEYGDLSFENEDFYNFLFQECKIPDELYWYVWKDEVNEDKYKPYPVFKFQHKYWLFFMDYYQEITGKPFFHHDDYLVVSSDLESLLFFHNGGALLRVCNFCDD